MPNDLMTVAEVARTLTVSTKHIYALIRRGELAHLRVGQSIRIEAAEVERYVREHTRPRAVPA